MKRSDPTAPEPVAGNGLLHRRAFLTGGGAALGAAWLQPVMPATAVAAEPPDTPAWMREPGAPMSSYGVRSEHESHVVRTTANVPGAPGTGISRTPLEHLEGTVTPGALHFERHHNGVPGIDPDRHRLMIHGLVRQPLVFDMNALSRYPLVSRLQFLECSGNSAGNNADEPPPLSVSGLHGLVACSEWTGVPLSVLLDEAGLQPEAAWVVAEGADAVAMSRSVPLSKAMDDAIVAIYQNGERLRPGNGYPVRLFLPGWEGNTSVKWLRRLQVTSRPAMARDETSKYSDLMPDGTALQFTFPMEVKSVITSPSGGMNMQGPGLYQISGLAWSGAGRIRRVEVSADGGRSWAEAALTEPVLSKCLTRFRLPWRWDGGPAVLQSRAIDETGEVQPSREAYMAERGPHSFYHYHAIQSWSIDESGEVRNVFA